jgi:hypothetical protein
MSMQIEGRFSAKDLGFLATTMRGFDPKKSFGLSRTALKASSGALVEASSTLAAATDGVRAMPIRSPGRKPATTPTEPNRPSTPKKPAVPSEPSTPSKPGWAPGNKPKPGRPLE